MTAATATAAAAGPAGPRLRPRAPASAGLALALCWLTLAPSPVQAAGRLECRAERAGQRALVSLELAGLLEAELRRLVELGLTGRLRLQATLYRRRAFWFDQRVGQEERRSVLSWSRARRTLELDGQPVRSEPLLPRTLSLRPDRGSLVGGEHYVEVTAHLEVVTAESLGEVARWLVAGRAPTVNADGTPQNAPAVLPRAVVGALAADLARETRGRCPVRAP